MKKNSRRRRNKAIIERIVKIVPDNAEEHFEKFLENVQTIRTSGVWRCLYVKLASHQINEPSRQEAIATRMKSSFEAVDKMYGFILTSGHLFLFFQGPVRVTIKNFEDFLSFISEGEEREEYNFFWELSNFCGYFDEILSGTTKENAIKNHQNQDEEIKNKNTFVIDQDVQRQRQLRYKPLLLLVEDDRTTRHFLQAMLEKYCDIVVAWHATQAQNLYQSMLPNITLLDINLPGGDGRELAEIFCSNDPDAFVVMASGSLSADNVKRCMDAGVKGTIAKPVKESQLLSYIHKYNQIHQKKEIANRSGF